MVQLAKLTVVIPTYNRAHLIHRAIDSVLGQSQEDWKLLIMDDASEDHTKQLIKSYKLKDSRIHYYRMPKNKGISHVLNKALKLVQTEFMLQLDSDDWLEKETLGKLLDTMEQEPQTTAMCYGNHLKWFSDDQYRLKKSRPFHRTHKYELLTYPGTVYPRFYRVSCLRQVGGWDTSDPCGGRHMEDIRIMGKLIEHFDLYWLDEPMYNLMRYNQDRLTLPQNRDKYNEIRKTWVWQKIKDWGNEFTPQFSDSRWVRVDLNPNHPE